ncbi:Retinol dehydrogenase 12 [Apiospora sp. TS-2023a]
MGKLRESYPLGAIRRQSKAKLAHPTASFKDQTVVIIGATGVMCSEAAKILAQLDVGTLVFGIRNLAKAERLADDTVSHYGLPRERILIKQVDLVSFESTKAFAADLQSLPRLDVLLIGSATNNTKRFVTGDGWEENLQVIHLSCALLTILLLPKLQTSADENRAPRRHQQRLFRPVVDYLRDVSDDKVVWKLGQYGVCKIVSYCWFGTLASLLDPSHVHVHSLDPGCTKSPLSTNSIPARIFLGVFGRSPVLCGRAIANSCLPVENAHGAMLWDYEVEKYGPTPRTMHLNIGSRMLTSAAMYRPTKFMSSERTREMRKVIWEETRSVLELLSPEAVQVYADLDQKSGGLSSDRIDRRS